jgi:hypothetical protein
VFSREKAENVSAIGPPVSMIHQQLWQCELRSGEIVPVRAYVRVPAPAVAHEQDMLQLPLPEHDWPEVVVVPAVAAVTCIDGVAVVDGLVGVSVGVAVGAGVPHEKE